MGAGKSIMGKGGGGGGGGAGGGEGGGAGGRMEAGNSKRNSKDSGGDKSIDEKNKSVEVPQQAKRGSLFASLTGGAAKAVGGGPSRKSSVVADDPKNRNASSMDWINSGLEAARSQSIDAGSDKEQSNKGGKGGGGGLMANLKSAVMGEKSTNSGGTDGIVAEGSSKSLAGGGGEGSEAGSRTRDEDGDGMDEDDQITPSKFKSRGGMVVIKPRAAEGEQEDVQESPPVSRLVSPTNSQRHTPRGEDGERLDATEAGASPAKSVTKAVFKDRKDLGGPQRYLVTVAEVAELSIDQGKIYFRAFEGGRTQESKRHQIGDRLVQGIVKVWTGNVTFNDEFYFEVADPDTYIYLELRQETGGKKGEKKEDLPVGKEIKVHCKGMGVQPADEWHELGEDVGHVRLRCQKVQRTEDQDNDGDEQAIMAALQKHSTTTDVMLRLSVRVVQAVDVLAMDEGGTSDPYIILSCGATKKRTKVINKTLHPQYHEDFDFFFPAGTQIPSMEVEMWDRDASSRDDFMGKAVVAIGGLTDWKPRLEWVELMDKETLAGRLQMGMAMEPKKKSSDAPLQDKIVEWYSSEDSMMSIWEHMAGGVGGKRLATAAGDSEDMPPATLRITVLRAKDLLAADRGGTSDPYARAHIGDDVMHQKKTEVKNKTLNPTWMEGFELHVASVHRHEGLTVEVFDKDMIGADDSLGKLVVPLDSLVPDKEYRDWYQLEQTSADVTNHGQVELQMTLVEITNTSNAKQEAAVKGTSSADKGKQKPLGAAAGGGAAAKGLTVLVVGGRGMPKMDSGLFGKCDPYLKMTIGDDTKQTKVIKRSLAPTWNETFNFDIPFQGDGKLLVECYDYDMVGDHDLIGIVSIPAREIKAKRSEWMKLTHPDNPEFNAEVYLTLSPLFESAEEAAERQTNEAANASKEANSSVLTITVQAARNLEAMDSGGTSDPYAIAAVGKEKRKTKVVKKELAPEWNEKFEIIVGDLNVPLNLSVWDKDMIGSDDMIGETMIPLTPLVGSKQAAKWYTIYRESKITGEVLLAIKIPRPVGWVDSIESSETVGSGDVGASASNLDVALPHEFRGMCCPPPVRVYVSATLSDMSRERHHMNETVFPHMRRLCEDRRIFFVAVDVRIGMVEETAAAVEQCLAELHKCSVFLCFLGEKYGVRVEDVAPLVAARPWLEAMGGKSLVEVEAAYATIQEPERFENRAFVYMRDPSYIDLLPGAARGDYQEEDAEYTLALSAFKKRLIGVEGLPIVENYTEPEAVMQQVTRDLKRCINTMYPKATRTRLLTIQRTCLLQYAREHVYHYYLDADAAIRLSNYVAFGDRCVLNIVGPPGSGKTSLLRTFLNLYEARRAARVFIFPHFDLGCAGVESAKGVLRRFLFEMKKQFNVQARVPTDYIQIQRTFLLWLRMATSKGKVVFVIDGADGFDEPNDGLASFLACIPRVLPLDVRLVLTMESGSRAYDTVTKRVSYCNTLHLGRLSIKARRSIAESMVERLGKTSEEALDARIVSHASCKNPLHLRITTVCYLQTGVFLPSAGIESMLEDVLEGMEREYARESPGLVQRIMTSIARSRRGLTDDEVMGIAGVSRWLWSKLVERCHDLLDGTSSLINFHHSTLDDVVCKRWMPEEEDKQKVTVFLASYFEPQPLSFRKAEEFPWLLFVNAQFWVQTAQPSEWRRVWQRLRDALADVDTFLVLYCDEFVSDLHDFWHGMEGVYDLVDEYSAALDGYQSKNAMAGETERILPVWHLARCQSALASFFVDSSRYAAACEMYMKAIANWDLSPGRQGDAADTSLQLGETYMGWGKLAEAEDALKQAIGRLEEAKGMNHVDVGRAMFLAADAMRRQKKESEGLPFCSRALEVLDSAMSADDKLSDPLFARCSYTLGVLEEIDGRMNAAEKSYKHAIKYFASSAGENHPDFCQALECLAGVCRSQGRLSDAAAHYQRLLPLKEEMSILGGSLGDVTSSLNNLAAVFVQLNDLRAAEVLYRKTVRIREHQYGHSHPTVARSIEMLANMLSELGDVQDAAFLLQRALNIRERAYGKDHMETAATLVNLSTVQCRRGQYNSGRDLFKRWAKIFITSLGHTHPTSVWALHWLDRWPEGGAPGTKLPKKSGLIKGKTAVTQLSGGQIFVNIIRGRNLNAMDGGKYSDPFIILQFGAEKKKTKVVKRTVNPQWDEKFQFAYTEDDRKNGVLVLQCFDKDVMGDDDNMGRFSVRLQDLPVWQAYRVWTPFEDAEEHSGEIELEIFMSEDTVPPVPTVKPRFDPTGKTVLEQFEEREKRDNARAVVAAEAGLVKRELGYREAARRKMNRASEMALKRETRRQARIAAGLDPDAFEDEDEDEDEDEERAGDAGGGGGADNADVGDGGAGGGGSLLSLDSDAKQLVEGRAPVKRTDDEQAATPMHLAAMMGHIEKLERLIEMGEDAEIKDLDGLTPLHYACGEGHLDCVVALLDGGASVESRDAENDMPIHIACQEGQQEVVHELLERYPYLLQMSGSGHSTLLHMVAASHEDRTSLLEMLLGVGANVDVKDGEGKTALEIAELVEDEEPDHPHLGILQGAMGITKAFVSAEEGSALRRATAEKAYNAIKNKDRRTLEKLLSGGMDVNGTMDEALPDGEDKGLTPVLLATRLLESSAVKMLASNEWGNPWGLSVTQANSNGLQPLHMLALHAEVDEPKSREILEVLLEHNPDCGVADRKGYTPLHYACQTGNLHMVSSLIERGGADVQVKTEDERTALHVAALHQRGDVVTYIVGMLRGTQAGNFTFVSNEDASRTVINMTDTAGCTALHFAAQDDGNEEWARLLLQAGANPIMINKEGHSPVDIAKNAKQAVLMDVLGRAAVQFASDQADEVARKMMMLAYAVKDNDVDRLCKAIFERGFDVASPVDEVGDTLLHTAASLGRIECMDQLLRAGSYHYTTNNLGCTPLHAAAMDGQTQAILWLIKHGADPRANDSDGYMPMHYAASEGKLEAFRALVENGRCDASLPTFQGENVLHCAASNSRRNIIEYVLRRAPELALAPDADGQLPVSQDMPVGARGRDPQVKALLDAAAAGDMSLLMSLLGEEPHLEPITFKFSGAVVEWERLASTGSDGIGADDATEPAYTPRSDLGDVPQAMATIVAAIEDRNMGRIQLMVGGGAVQVGDVCDAGTEDRLIHKAASVGYIEAMQVLLDAGADVNGANRLGLTPLHMATIEGKIEAIEWLLEKGANPSLEDSAGYLPLHYAAAEGHMSILGKLSLISDMLARTKQGLNSLHIAVASKRSAPVEYLLRNKPSLSSMPDAQGQTPADYYKGTGFDDSDVWKQLSAAASGSSLLVMVSTDTPKLSGV